MTAMNDHISVVETERLILRAPREEDYSAFAKFGESARTKWVGATHERDGTLLGYNARIYRHPPEAA